jgi:hypothetical protein
VVLVVLVESAVLVVLVQLFTTLELVLSHSLTVQSLKTLLETVVWVVQEVKVEMLGAQVCFIKVQHTPAVLAE